MCGLHSESSEQNNGSGKRSQGGTVLTTRLGNDKKGGRTQEMEENLLWEPFPQKLDLNGPDHISIPVTKEINGATKRGD